MVLNKECLGDFEKKLIPTGSISMKRGTLPSLNALLVFECAARHSNFTRAAEELHITQGAISSQMRLLEDHLGFSVFNRIRQRVTLTEPGHNYFIEVRRVLAELAETTHRVRTLAGAPTITLAVVPTFATYWLVPRLPNFLEANPDVTVIFRTRLAPFDFRGEGIDAAIHNGEPSWPHSAFDYLMSETILPVCSSQFKAKSLIEHPEDLDRVRLLHLSSRFSAWDDWFSRASLQRKQVHQIRGLAFDQYATMASAAVAGAGVALLPRFLIDSETQSGALEILFPEIPSAKHSYNFVYMKDTPMPPMLAAFRTWLLDKTASGRESSNTD